MKFLYLTIQTHHAIRCPGCLAVLAEHNIRFWDSVAMCVNCRSDMTNVFKAQLMPTSTPNPRGRPSDYTNYCGLHLWTPWTTPPVPLTQLKWPEHREWMIEPMSPENK